MNSLTLFPRHFQKSRENSLFFLESRRIFDAENSSPVLDIQSEFNKLDTNNDQKLDDSEAIAEQDKQNKNKTETSEKFVTKIEAIHEAAVKVLIQFYKATDKTHNISAESRARQVLETETYTLESRKNQHVDMIFQDYLKIFEDYAGAKKEKVRTLGAMAGGREETLPRNVQHIDGMKLELKAPSSLTENKGLKNITEKFPNAKILIVEVNGDKKIELFKTGIVKIEALERFGKKTGIRVLDGDGDIHIYDTITGRRTITKKGLDTAEREKKSKHSVSRSAFITSDHEKITDPEFEFLKAAREKVNKIIEANLTLKNGEKNGDQAETQIDWNDMFDEVFFEKDGNIWIDTEKTTGLGIDLENKLFMESDSKEESEKNATFLNKNRDLLFGDSIEQIQKNKILVQKQRLTKKKEEKQQSESYYANNSDKFLKSNLAKKEISQIDFTEKKDINAKNFKNYVQKILPKSRVEKTGNFLKITTQDGDTFEFSETLKLGTVSEEIGDIKKLKEPIREGISIHAKLSTKNTGNIQFRGIDQKPILTIGMIQKNNSIELTTLDHATNKTINYSTNNSEKGIKESEMIKSIETKLSKNPEQEKLLRKVFKKITKPEKKEEGETKTTPVAPETKKTGIPNPIKIAEGVLDNIVEGINQVENFLGISTQKGNLDRAKEGHN